MTQEEFYDEVEKQYSIHGASGNGAQIQIRHAYAKAMIETYGIEFSSQLLKKFFHYYHEISEITYKRNKK